jgi:peptidoglycan-associated lipoprotein
MITFRAAKFAAAVALALVAAACSNQDSITGGTLAGGPGGFGAGGGGGAASPGSTQDFAVNVGDRVFFESDSTDLTPQAVATLDRQAQWLSRYPRYAILLEGHADERGTREYNFSLGARRAQTVREYLASRGVDASRVRTVSYGKERPVAVCNDISCWSQNRRAVTVLDNGAGA